MKTGVSGTAEKSGGTAVREVRYRVGDMDCPSCLSKIERHLESVEGVMAVQGSVLARTLTVTIDEGYLQEVEIPREVARLGYAAEPMESNRPGTPRPGTWTTAQARRVYAAAALVLVGVLSALFAIGPTLPILAQRGVAISDLAFVVAALVGGWNFFPKGLAAVRRLALDMNFLMSVAIVGAVILGEFVEAASIAVLFSLAELLETYSVDRARASIASLLEMAPAWAVVVRDGREITVPAESLVAGDLAILRPGDRVPADGTVVNGSSTVDQSAITGESLPVEKAAGDPVFSGTINRHGTLRIRVDRPAAESALANIVRLVQEAESRKSTSERFVDRFARVYTPIIAVGAVIVGVVPPLFFDAPATLWVTRALTLLVIACPCALVISTPVAVVSGLTAAARHGVLIKGGAYLEALASTRVFAFDKTGTLTHGHPMVEAVIAVSGDEADALARAAAVEAHSEHPLARAIVEEAGRRRVSYVDRRVTQFEALPGRGARARVDGEEHLVGRPSLFPDEIPPPGLEASGRSVIGVARRGGLLAWIALADRPRPEAPAAIAELRGLGIERIVMVTGDNRGAAEWVRTQVGIDEVSAELLPEQKLALVEELRERHGSVAMVGDGVNDAPALAAASVGIAMGAAGSDTALETADAALMGDDLRRLPYMVRLARRARSVMRQNIAASIAVKALLAIGVPLGYVSLIGAVLIGDLGVSLAVTANALRLAQLRE